MKPPCMVVVQHILPALRVAIARELMEDHGLKRVEIAERMEVTPAAITQYLNRSRGERMYPLIEGSSRIMEIVSDIAGELARGESPADRLLYKLCLACREVRASRLLCDLHIESMPSLGEVESCACSLGLVGWDPEPPELE